MSRFLLLLTIASELVATASAADGAPSKYALLIGCTQYPNCKLVRPLRGPQNDVPLLARVLTDRFGFEEKNIVRLVGWPKEPELRPTHQNITASFDSLIQKAAPGTQIVILMSGHGTQVPIPEDQKNPLDVKNPESDGLDEVFLPADVTTWSTKGLGNAIRDDQIGGWLNALRAKGASVWILFDCCHSGTMTRGDEISRAAPQDDLGIPIEAMQRVRDIVRRTVTEHDLLKEAAPVDLHPVDPSGGGSITAFYAAQPFEEAPELPRPAGAARVAENYYGLMTFVVAQALLEQPAGRPLTYRDLSQLVLSRYRAERGSRGPTPLFDIGDDREVLGLKAGKWPQRTELSYEKHVGELRVVGGTLRGLTPGSTLKLLPSTGPTRNSKPIFVRVKSATATAAVAEPCEHAGTPAAAIGDVPAIGRCEIVSRDLGDMRVKLRTRPSNDQALRDKNAILNDVLKSLSPAAQDLATPTKGDEPDAWVLWLASPEEAREFGFELTEPRVLLVHPDAFSSGGTKSNVAAASRIRTGRPSAQYGIAPAGEIAAQLENDIRRIFTWQCLWRLTGQMAGQKAEKPPVTLEVATVKSAEDPAPGELLRSATLHPGQFLEVRVGNPSDENQWVTVLFLAADLSIQCFAADGVSSEKALKPFRIELNDSSLGNEGLVVLSLPMSEYRQQPDLRFLEQEALGAGSRAARPQAAGLETPFGKLMRAALAGKTTRGPAADAPDIADFASWTWTTIPKTGRPQ